MKKNKTKDSNWDQVVFPIVKNIMPKTIVNDIKCFDPNNSKDVQEWDEMMKVIFDKVKKDFDEKGIPIPQVVFHITPGPITYDVKIIDSEDNMIHVLILNKDKDENKE